MHLKRGRLISGALVMFALVPIYRLMFLVNVKHVSSKEVVLKLRSSIISRDSDEANETDHTGYCQIKMSKKLDLMRLKPLTFSPRFKNPCWYGGNHTLLCLPYFYLIGAAKCGTTDLYHRISLHPEFKPPKAKEPNWLSSSRFYENPGLGHYVSRNFQYLAYKLTEALKKTDNKTKDPIKLITGDASVSTMTGANAWQILPENVGRQEPVTNNPDYIYHLNPHTRILMMIRNPVDRLWSEYLAFSEAKEKSAAIFHQLVTSAIDMYENCTRSKTLRSCMYNRTLFSLSSMTEEERKLYPSGCHRPETIVQIRRGVYHVFLQDYLKRFPKGQVLVQRLEDHSRDPVTSLRKVFSFLGMRSMSKDTETKIQKGTVRNARKPHDKGHGDMLPETRQLLFKFYQPHNQKMATLMEEDSYNYGPGPG